MIEASTLVAIKVDSSLARQPLRVRERGLARETRLTVDLRRHLHDFWGQHRSICTHSIDDLLPHAPLHYAATGEMVKGSLKLNSTLLGPPPAQ